LARQWGTPPWEIRKKLNEILISDILEAIKLEASLSFDSKNVFNYFILEEIAEENNKKKQLEIYNEMLKNAKTPEEKKKIISKVKELNKNGPAT
jgi:Spy/CpxP family protein refolding chaperone